jgi:hypothetical protein
VLVVDRQPARRKLETVASSALFPTASHAEISVGLLGTNEADPVGS